MTRFVNEGFLLLSKKIKNFLFKFIFFIKVNFYKDLLLIYFLLIYFYFINYFFNQFKCNDVKLVNSYIP